ncbi:rho GDP-dissociation inhibitor 1-like [Acropora palmata]|uniref:rho GDP-dissociation inhibitor 1-like n=1 Tax=Acropora palmata TaxID=6131 RepID=UPI003D9FE318
MSVLLIGYYFIVLLTSWGGTILIEEQAGDLDGEERRKFSRFLYLVTIMADPNEQAAPVEDDEPEETPGYKAPAQKTLDEIQQLDADDESLVRYKQMLLGGATAGADDGGVNVSVDKMSIVIDGRKDIDLDLTGDLAKLKDFPVTIKEGISYRIKITFQVKREIVAGLKYHQVTSRKGIRVDKSSIMVGSYGPKLEAHEFLTPPEEAPKGMIARGSYTAKSRFLDDDKNCYLEWEWRFDIKKDWD